VLRSDLTWYCHQVMTTVGHSGHKYPIFQYTINQIHKSALFDIFAIWTRGLLVQSNQVNLKLLAGSIGLSPDSCRQKSRKKKNV